MAKIKEFFKNAFSDMKESAKEQHKVDKAQFEAAKTEAKANFAEAKAKGSPTAHKKIMQKEREEKIAEANARTKDASERIDALKK